MQEIWSAFVVFCASLIQLRLLSDRLYPATIRERRAENLQIHSADIHISGLFTASSNKKPKIFKKKKLLIQIYLKKS